jgi:hypothetical protein
MSVRSAPFFWLACDAPECGARCPNEDDESIAFSDDSGAIEVAADSYWQRTSDGRDYCDNHALNVCDQCQAYDPTPLAGEREYLCVQHWNESELATPAEKEET